MRFISALLVLICFLPTACAGKPARNAQPSAPISAQAAEDDSEFDDDFAALYGETAANKDPWERYNRRVHRFNVALDRHFARPLAKGYTRVTPRFVQGGINNFFNNLRSPVTMLNQVLQGRPSHAWDSLGRFVMNTTLGVGGLFDPASKAQIPQRSEDFGQTFAVWGWRQSRYFELPLFGPRTIRDALGLAADAPVSPLWYVSDHPVRYGLQAVQFMDIRAQLLSLDELRDSAADEYSLIRDAWLQRRQYQIENE